MEQGGADVKEQRYRIFAKLRAPGWVAICVPVCLGMGIGSRKHSASQSWDTLGKTAAKGLRKDGPR